MKTNWIKISIIALTATMLAPVALLAQKEEKDVQQIIVTRKGDKKDEKCVIEINGDKITVNGKPLDEYKDKNGDLNVRLNKLKDIESLTFNRVGGRGGWNSGDKDAFTFFGADENRAMLGVTTSKADEGVVIETVTKESAAEKAGLKEKDIITRVDDKKIEEPDDLSDAIQKHKVGDKVSITYLRDKKESKTSAELSKWKGVGAWTISPKTDFKMNMDDMNFDHVMPKVNGQLYNYNWSGGNPKLGLSVQDSDEGKGVKVIDVDEESNAAKAGIKENDIITEVDGKTINNADDMVKVVKESKEKISVMIKLQRDGKPLSIEVKMPRKLKSANL